MSNNLKFYIDGAWVAPSGNRLIDVEDPSTETVFTKSLPVKPPMWTAPWRPPSALSQIFRNARCGPP